MSTIRKQSILSSIYIYLGFAIGAVNILYLFPHYFEPEQLGLTRILLDVGMIFSMLCTLGGISVLIKFFPFYKGYLPARKNDLSFLTLGAALLGCFLFVLTLPLLQGWLVRKFGQRSPLFVDYFYLIYPVTFTLTLLYYFEGYAWSIRKPGTVAFLKELLYRLLVTVIILLFASGIIRDFSVFMNLYAWLYAIPVALLIVTAVRSGNFTLTPKISSVTRRLGSRMAAFGGAMFLSALLNVIAKTNDTIILASQSSGGLRDAAVFTIATYLITLMEAPQRGMAAAATSHIAQAWKDRDKGRIERIYQKTALNLLVAGTGILGLLIVNGDNIVEWLGPAYAPITSILLVFGVARLIDLGTGLNTQILMLSKYWKLDLFTNILFVAFSIGINYYLTKRLNVMGPAWGNLISLVIYNSIRFIYIWKLFGLQPFSRMNLYTLIAGILCLGVVWILPDLKILWVNIIFKSGLYLLLYAFIILGFRISPDINELLVQLRNKILPRQ